MARESELPFLTESFLCIDYRALCIMVNMQKIRHIFFFFALLMCDLLNVLMNDSLKYANLWPLDLY